MPADAQADLDQNTPLADDALQQVADRLSEQGWAITPNFVTVEIVAGLSQDIETLAAGDQLRPAAVGRGASRQVQTDIRGDQIDWLSDQGDGVAQRSYIALMRELQNALNQQLFLGLAEFECHFARYLPGTFYGKHLDQHLNQDTRVVSAILYLNTQWMPRDGGELRLYFSDDSFIDVPPVAGTLVTFLSDRFFHEVLPTESTRCSVTGWFRRRRAGYPL